MTEAAGLRQWHEQLWTLDGDRVRMLGIPFSTRMTIVRLDGGRTWLHSPVAPTPSRVAAVAELGDVAHIVAPNKFHHLYAGDWLAHFPAATLWGPPELPARRPDLAFQGVLRGNAPPAWSQEIDQVHFRGSKVLSEFVFLHRASKTIVVTDIIQNHDPEQESWFWRKVKSLNGILAPRGGVPKDWRVTVRDRDLARAARDRIAAWDYDRLILAHGVCVETGARTFVEQAFTWLDETDDADEVEDG